MTGADVIALILTLMVAIFALSALVSRQLARHGREIVPQLGRIIDGMHVHQIGPPDAPPLVLIHGLYGQMQHFTYAMAAPLAKRYRVILVDRAGGGYSPRTHALSPAAHGAAIARVLERLEIAQPILVGHSLGGAVAVEMALDAPDRYRGLTLLAPAVLQVISVPVWLPRAARLFVAPVLPFLTMTVAAPLVWLLRPLIRSRVFGPEPVLLDYTARGGAALGLQAVVLQGAVEDVLMLAETAPQRAARVAHETLPVGIVVFGDGDQIVPPTPQIAALAAQGWDTVMLPGRGHMIPLTAPKACVAAIDRLAANTARDNSGLDISPDCLG